MDVFHNGCESSRRSKQKVLCCHVLVVQRNISSTTADGKLAEYPAVVRVECDMEKLEVHSARQKKQGMAARSANGCGMHDEKRVKWRVSRRVWRSAGMQSLVSCGRSPDSEAGGCVMRLQLPRIERHNGLNTK